MTVTVHGSTRSDVRSALLLPRLARLPSGEPAWPPAAATPLGRTAGSNLLQVRDHNQLLVLHAIRTGAGSTRRALAEITGLTFQTVENISRRLIDAGIVADLTVSGGRSRELAFRPRGAHAVGITLGAAAVDVALCTADGACVRTDRRAMGAGTTPTEVLDWLARAVPDLIDAADVPVTTVLGAGVLLDGERWPESRRPATAALLQARLGMPTAEAAPAVAALRHLQWTGPLDVDDALYVHLGDEVHCCVVSNGLLRQGARDRPGPGGQFGHITVSTGGARCSCGRRGCLRAVIAADALRAAVGARLQLDAPPSMSELAALVDATPLAAATVTRAAHQLARALLPAVQLIVPATVVLGGPTVEATGGLLGRVVGKKLRDRLGSATPRVESAPSGTTPATEAATVVLYQAFSPDGGRVPAADGRQQGQSSSTVRRG